MDEEFRPVDQPLVDLGQRLGVVFREFDAFPELGGHVGAFDRLHVEIEDAVFAADCGVARVGEGARLPVAETRDVVFIAAEVLAFCGPGIIVRSGIVGVGGKQT